MTQSEWKERHFQNLIDEQSGRYLRREIVQMVWVGPMFTSKCKGKYYPILIRQ